MRPDYAGVWRAPAVGNPSAPAGQRRRAPADVQQVALMAAFRSSGVNCSLYFVNCTPKVGSASNFSDAVHGSSARPKANFRTSLTNHIGAPPEISVETGDAAIIRGLLLQTDFLAALSLNRMYREVASGEVVVLPIELQGSARKIGNTAIHNALCFSCGSDGFRSRLREAFVGRQRLIFR